MGQIQSALIGATVGALQAGGSTAKVEQDKKEKAAKAEKEAKKEAEKEAAKEAKEREKTEKVRSAKEKARDSLNAAREEKRGEGYNDRARLIERLKEAKNIALQKKEGLNNAGSK